MKILLESVPIISPQQIKQWNDGNENVRSKIFSEIINQYNNSNIDEVAAGIRPCFYQHGIDPRKNGFIELFDKFNFKLDKKHIPYIKMLNNLYTSENLDLSEDYLVEPSLWNRSMNEFIYTVRLFDTVLTPYKLRKFFKNTELINKNDLFNGSNIKPVGKEGDGTETLFGTVESWSGQNGENDIPPDYRKDGNNYGDEKLTLSRSKKLLIKQKYSFDDPSQIPNILHKKGQVVFVKSLKPHSDPQANIDNYINDFIIYDGKDWKRIE